MVVVVVVVVVVDEVVVARTYTCIREATRRDLSPFLQLVGKPASVAQLAIRYRLFFLYTDRLLLARSFREMIGNSIDFRRRRRRRRRRRHSSHPTESLFSSSIRFAFFHFSLFLFFNRLETASFLVYRLRSTFSRFPIDAFAVILK